MPNNGVNLIMTLSLESIRKLREEQLLSCDHNWEQYLDGKPPKCSKCEIRKERATWEMIDFLLKRVDQWEKRVRGLSPKITPQDIRQVMENLGESLTDLGATYAKDFAVWLRGKRPTIFSGWVADQVKSGHYDPQGKDHTITLDSEELLFDFSNNSLGGLIPDMDAHDGLLAEFCNQCPAAHDHIMDLLEGS